MSLRIAACRRIGLLATGGVALLLTAGAYALSNRASKAETFQGAGHAIPTLSVAIVKTHPHDARAFTQGLEYFNGFLYESTGETGRSSVRKVEIESGRVLQKTDLSADYFGEGLTIFRGRIYQVTWLTKTGFVYDLGTLRKLREFHYDGEGWGLTHDDANLILSDGTNRLRYLNPETLGLVGTLEVYAGREAVTNLNELERIGSDIYANVWHSNRIARIDGRSGEVLAWIDCSAIASREQRETEAVLNGIAYDSGRRRFFVTGKNWAHLFEIRVEGNLF